MTTGTSANALRKLWILIGLAILATLPALYLRATAIRPDPMLDAALFGVAILAAGFMLSWGAESAEGQISSGLILAIVALVVGACNHSGVCSQTA